MYNQKSKARAMVTTCVVLGMISSICQADPITGSGATNYIPKFTSPFVVENSILYEVNGRIGIGTTNPERTLHVNSGLTNSVALFESTDPAVAIMLKDDTTTAGGEAIVRLGNNLALWTDGTPRLTILPTTGNVGIGTETPSRRLTVRGNVLVERSDGTSVVELGEGSAQVRIEKSTQDVSIAMKDNTTAAADPVALRRRGDNLSLFTNGAERVMINSNGDFHVYGFTFLTLSSSLPQTYYNVLVGTDGKLYRSQSSLRYKTAVRDLGGNANAVLDLRPVRFEWKSTGKPEIGLIAEEVEKVLPDLVVCDADGHADAVKYDKVPMYLLKVIQTQQSQITALEERLKALEEAVKHIDTKAGWPVTDIPSGPRE